MIGVALTLALACTEPDGGTCAQEVTAGPFNAAQAWPGGGGTGQYTTRLWQSPTSPGTACAMLTTYVGVCSSFARSPLLSGGNGGSLGLQNGGHRQVLWSDFSDFSPDADDFGELGAVGYRWKRVTAYEHVASPRAIVCDGGSDGVCVDSSMPRGSNLRFYCPSSGGCEWRPGDSYLGNVWEHPIDGTQACVRNMSAGSLLVADHPDAGVDLEGDFVGGQSSRLCLERVAEQWVETSRSTP